MVRLGLLSASFLAASLLPAAFCYHQRPFSSSFNTTSTTLVDALSEDPDYTSLLLLLQRTRLIPTLNRLSGSTLFAPTNDAIRRHATHNSLWASLLQPDFVITDNVHEQLRQQLFYHLLNESISFPQDHPEKVRTLKTLHFPKPLDPPSRDPPPNPPWIPLPGGSLGGEPQRLRVSARGDSGWIGVDASGKGGHRIVKGRVNAGNGVLLGIDGVLEPPPDLATVISQQPRLSYFQKVLTPEMIKELNNTSELTLFLPINEAWDALDPYERLYLESDFAADDLLRIVNMHAVAYKAVQWSESLGDGVNLTTIDGSKLEIVITPDKTKVSDADLVQPDIYASNGVLHLVSSLLVPDGALQITPEKHLLALGCTSFVSLIHSTNLTSLINNTEVKSTILAPTDDVISVLAGPELPKPGSEELKRLLQYHFIPGRWLPRKLGDGMLLETELIEDGLGGGRQVLPVEVNADKAVKNSITFGGVSILDGPIEVNDTVIYFISRPILPPADVMETLLPNLDLSVFLAAALSTSVADKLKKQPSTSLLIPHNAAFERLGGLVSGYLLAPTAKSELESVLMHHILSGVQYTQSTINGSQHSFGTLEGSDVSLEKESNGTIFIRPSGGWSGMKTELFPKNILTKTGVVHELSDILLPRSVNMTVGKLVTAAKGSTMLNLVGKAGMGWVLNGTAPPEGSPWDEQGLGGAAWTLLCPTDDAFKTWNLTELFADMYLLRMIVSQHLIPVPNTANFGDPVNNNQPLFMDDSVTYSTLRSPSSSYGDLAFRPLSEDGKGYGVRIKGARDANGQNPWANVLSWGRATTWSGRGGVIQIDRVLAPYQPSSWREYGGPGFVFIVGLSLLSGFFYGINVLWRRDYTEATYEPVGGFGEGEEDS